MMTPCVGLQSISMIPDDVKSTELYWHVYYLLGQTIWGLSMTDCCTL